MRNLEDKRTAIFPKEELEEEEELFEQRSALFFTPTQNIPDKYIGEGEFHVILPFSLPNYLDVLEIQAYQSPKLWVHLKGEHQQLWSQMGSTFKVVSIFKELEPTSKVDTNNDPNSYVGN